MNARKPQNPAEERLMKKEDWQRATIIDSYWCEEDCTCDFCRRKITGRHMIDGVVGDSFQFALMCPQCHKVRGNGFGSGKGQLYTKLSDGQWLQTFGFTQDQLEMCEEEADEDDW
jgi:hypothetical protein